MTDDDLIEELRRTLVAYAPVEESPTPECLDDDTMAALAEGSLDPTARAASLPHLASCARCRRAVASVARALADASLARELVRAERASPRRLYRIVVPAAAAAAALVLLLAWPRGPNDGEFPGAQHRAPGPTVATQPVPIAPVGTVAEAGMLRWSAVPSADRYRVTLFDDSGQVLYETQLSDTTAVLPDSILLVPGGTYLWKVEARVDWDRWSSSEVVPFSIAGGTPR